MAFAVANGLSGLFGKSDQPSYWRVMSTVLKSVLVGVAPSKVTPRMGILRPSKRSQDAAVGSIRVADQHERHRQRRTRRGEVALLDRCDSRALRVAEDDDRLAGGLCVDRLIEVGHSLPDRLVEGHGSRHRHELLGCADRSGRARPGAAESGQHDVVVVGVGGVAVDELRAVLRSAQRMPGAAHDQCGRGEGDQRRHGLHARQHDRGRDRQHDDTGGIEETAHSKPPEAVIAVGRPRAPSHSHVTHVNSATHLRLLATICAKSAARHIGPVDAPNGSGFR